MENDEVLNCGHTEAEHTAKALLIAQAVSEGDFTPLIAYIDNEALASALQAVVMETFIRSEDDVTARDRWMEFVGLVDATFFAEESAFPQLHQHVLKERKQFCKAVEQQEFETEASHDIKELTDLHGVTDDDVAGFYL